MSATAQKSFIWLWMAALLTATVGISVHQIYCYCAGQSRVAVFTTPDDRCVAKPAADCCQKDLPACCTKGEKAGDKQDCTEESTQVFQLKTEFVVDKPLEKTFDCPLWLHDLPFFARKLKPALCDATPSFHPIPPPSPPSGREICVRHELFLC